MTTHKITIEFKKKKEDFNRLGQNLVEALKTFLNEKDIPYLDIYYRVKKLDSFLEKIERKKYSDPFDEIEDICGIRIICYYASDIERINNIINEELNVIEEQDKSDLLGLKEFAYRSKHYIVKINDSWLSAPNYRKLQGLKSEIQVRTILMHAWAEIEHKLNYKSDAQVPDKFQRKLFRLSAKFEEADEQFEELRIGIDNYKESLKQSIINSNSFDLNQDFNIDSFKAFIKFHFPEYSSYDDYRLEYSFDDYQENNKGFIDFDKAIKKVHPFLEEIKNDLLKSGYDAVADDSSELLGMALDITDEESYLRRDNTMKNWREVVDKWRLKIK